MVEPGPGPEIPASPPEPEAGAHPDAGRPARAEQVLRAAEDFNRATLDAVSAQVAVLDQAGTIVAVNRPQQQFALENSGRPREAAARTGIATSDLEICRAARGPGAEGAAAVHDGILAVQLPVPPLTLDADPVRLTQILINLLDNAAKLTPEGGDIDLTALPVGQEAEIRVKDDGCGIDAALLRRVFDLFQQGEEGLDRASGGLGIGLTLVQRLSALHGGSVEAASAGVGRGSTVTLRLPAASGAAARPLSQAEGTAAPAVRKRILVVDDDAVARARSGLRPSPRQTLRPAQAPPS